jgi:transposase-like protein
MVAVALPRKGYPPEFRPRAVELLRSGRPVAAVARLLEASDAST